VCSGGDPFPQQSASSDPSANRAGIITRESLSSVRFYTTKTQSSPHASGSQLGSIDQQFKLKGRGRRPGFAPKELPFY
jgi:hypothetical protein